MIWKKNKVFHMILLVQRWVVVIFILYNISDCKIRHTLVVFILTWAKYREYII